MPVRQKTEYMADADAPEGPIEDFTELVDKNGLVKLFANRARARVVASLFYAEEPLSTEEIARGAGLYRSVVHETLDPLGEFDLLEELEGDGEDQDRPRYRLREGDELVEEIRTVAELATDRFYDED